MDWIKVSRTYLDNPTFGQLPEVIQARYFKLYLLAGICEQDGVINHTPEEIAWILHLTPAKLEETLTALTRANLYKNNGKGPELTNYLKEQISRDALEKEREAGRSRQANFRGKHNAVYNASVTPLPPRESESESEVEVESEKESRVSVESKGETRREFTDRLIPISKSEIISLLQIPPKFVPSLEGNKQICKADLLAEFARNMTRKNVSKPSSITAMNLNKGELPDEKWYHPREWIGLPSFIKKKIDLESLTGKSYQFGLSIEEGENEDNH